MKIFKLFSNKNFWIMLAGVVGIGIFQSFLVEVNFGTDTCAFMNLSLAQRVGLTLGQCMIITNILLFIPQLIWGRHLLGPGTLANMFLVGIVSDFCRGLEERYLPAWMFENLASRIVIFAVALLFFLISVAVYLNAKMGQTPYDAIPTMICEKLHVHYSGVRMGWDTSAAVIGIVLGGHFTIGNLCLILTLGPMVGLVGNIMIKISNKEPLLPKKPVLLFPTVKFLRKPHA